MEPTIGETQKSIPSLDAERTARFQKNLLELQMEASPDGLIVVSPSRSILLSNRRFVEIWRIPDAVVRMHDDHEAVQATRARVREPQEFVARIEWLYSHPEVDAHDELELVDGRVLERHTAPVRDRESGTYYGRLWSFRDISNRKLLAGERIARRAAEIAAKRQAILAEVGRVLMEGADDRTLRTVLSLLVPYLGRVCMLHLFGDDGSLVPLCWPPSSAGLPELAARDGAALAMRKRSRVFESKFLALPVQCRGEILGAAVFHADAPGFFDDERVELAEQVVARVALARLGDRLQRALRDAVSARDEFLSIASHELRSPVAGLQFASDALRRAISSGRVPNFPPTLSELLQSSENHVLRISTLVDTLLDVTKLRSGRLHLELEELDLRGVARDVVARHCAGAGLANCDVRLIGDRPVFGYWDRARVEQIIDNLVSNAVKYGAGKPVTVTVGVERGTARLVVADQGIGIPPHRVGRIFDRFERAVSARAYEGLGLGLYIVGQIVSRLGGRVNVESELGVGSTFTVELPTSGPSDIREVEA